jgi:hypothetical protein
MLPQRQQEASGGAGDRFMGQCLFSAGDVVRFTPSERTRGIYQDIESFGVKLNQELKIKKIVDDTYLYFDNDVGGWPWNEFTLVCKASK